MMRQTTLTHEIPRTLIELLYLRSASGLDEGEFLRLGDLPGLSQDVDVVAPRPITATEWIPLWRGEVRRLGTRGVHDPHEGEVHARLLAGS
ncbi:hypothetical protein MF406_09680 [Georgenia sp. TF02-10]|uniref:hypothetical protein n=1 Tax=Georgenia sp. TF02-10 TaxID=2917725 RepID=UPI001FA73DE6|nr:hypothetical protein [Georgenia sp. TF02-10]UNX53293.1 hypothetical protein MF406_09680 [Georgenia sp. TF02-10]